jgi:hypothetical protein
MSFRCPSFRSRYKVFPESKVLWWNPRTDCIPCLLPSGEQIPLDPWRVEQ